MTDKTILRITKLLALARDGGATQAEAELAMAKAQELMADNNLSMATLEASTGLGQEARTRESTDKRAMYKWQRDLMATIAEVNFCHASIRQEWNGRTHKPAGYDLIGRESNVVATTRMFEYLLQTIARLVMAEVGGDRTQHLSRSAMSFREGCAERLCARLQERHSKWMREQAAKARSARSTAPAGSQALVVVMEDWAQQESDLNDDLRFGYAPGTTAANRAKSQAQWAAASEKRRQQRAALVAQGIPEDVANWMSYGYLQKEAEAKVREAGKTETEAQARRRQEREAREWERYKNRQWRDAARRDSGAYRRGQEHGSRIGLDDQVDSDKAHRLT